MEPITHIRLASDFDRATEMLSDEHRLIERVLNVVEKLTREPVVSHLESWKKALDFIRHFADQCHHLKEEKILFPLMEEHGIPNDGGPIGMMLIEHEEGRSYVRSMLAALARVEANDEGVQESLAATASAYVRLLREHIEKEDQVLFPMADGVVPENEQKQLLRAFEEQEVAELGTGIHEKYFTVVQALETALR
jgi:hemerythrin-like domain-containing protein